MNFIVKSFNDLTKTELYEILKIRSQIFIVELKMNCLEIDGMDYSALHFILEEDGKILAYLRAFKEEKSLKIGRVLSACHNKGYGTNLMQKTMLYARQNLGLEKIILDSQKQAVKFYQKLGFKRVSDEFLEEGVPHFKMEICL